MGCAAARKSQPAPGHPETSPGEDAHGWLQSWMWAGPTLPTLLGVTEPSTLGPALPVPAPAVPRSWRLLEVRSRGMLLGSKAPASQ